MGTAKEKELYEQIKGIAARFLTPDQLAMCYHPYYSQTNEALNQKNTKTAPKNRTYSMTLSLTSRVAITVGTSCMGTQAFFTAVFSQAGIPLNQQTASFLFKTEENNKKISEYKKLPAVKWKRAKDKKLKMAEDLKKENEARRQGKDYSAGVAVLVETEAPKSREQRSYQSLR